MFKFFIVLYHAYYLKKYFVIKLYSKYKRSLKIEVLRIDFIFKKFSEKKLFNLTF